MTCDPGQSVPLWLADPPDVLARADESAGETVLRRRGDVLELVVDGVYAMDSAQVDSEVALARLALEQLDDDGGGLTVVVGGLGLGYTARAVLDDARVARCVVVELSAPLVDWAREGLVPVAAQALADPRCEVVVGDVAQVLPDLPAAQADAVLLDVDNGPAFLVHTTNEGLYGPASLRDCARALRPGGVLAVWCADASPGLADALAQHVGPVREVLLPVRRDERAFEYAVYLATR